MSEVTDILVGVDKLLSQHGFCEMASARHQLSIAISLHKQQLQQAHRAGWDQCQREVIDLAMSGAYLNTCNCPSCQPKHQLANGVAAMEYKHGD